MCHLHLPLNDLRLITNTLEDHLICLKKKTKQKHRIHNTNLFGVAQKKNAKKWIYI